MRGVFRGVSSLYTCTYICTCVCVCVCIDIDVDVYAHINPTSFLRLLVRANALARPSCTRALGTVQVWWTATEAVSAGWRAAEEEKDAGFGERARLC